MRRGVSARGSFRPVRNFPRDGDEGIDVKEDPYLLLELVCDPLHPCLHI